MNGRKNDNFFFPLFFWKTTKKSNFSKKAEWKKRNFSPFSCFPKTVEICFSVLSRKTAENNHFFSAVHTYTIVQDILIMFTKPSPVRHVRPYLLISFHSFHYRPCMNFGISFFVTFSAIIRLIHAQPVLNGCGNRIARRKTPRH